MNKIILKIISVGVIAVIFIICLVITAPLLNIKGFYRIYTVQSGSMEPNIHTGSIVIVQPQEKYKINDIITFKQSTNSESNPRTTITHRITNIFNDKYLTKGDANNASDGILISQNHIVGKVITTIPLLGYLITFSRTLLGLISLIVVPAVVFIVNEILIIKRQFGVVTTNNNKRKINDTKDNS